MAGKAGFVADRALSPPLTARRLELAQSQYAVPVLKSSLRRVLGQTDCGVVKTAINDVKTGHA